MRGLEISKNFWEEYGKPMIEERFPELSDKIAVGLIGCGSECYGYDDEISRDHDFEHGFCIFLPGEDIVDRRTAFLLERAYSALPGEYMGLRRNALNPAGGNRHGVFRTDEFYLEKTGISEKPASWRDYLSLPEYALAEITNGDVFYDGYGEFSDIRSAWKNPPRDVQLKKLAGYFLSMSQYGEYNFPRTLARCENAAARLILTEYIKSAVGAFLWIENRPVPYMKWSFRALRESNTPYRITKRLEELFESPLCECEKRIAEINSAVISLFDKSETLKSNATDLQYAAFAVNDLIIDSELRNLSLLSAV